MQVVDRSTGKTIEVPDEVVQAGFQSGKFALPKGAKIPIQRADGDMGTVPSEGLDAELKGGASIVPQSEFAKAAAAQKYGGLGGMAATAGLGLLSGASAGLSDVAIAKLGGEGARKYVQEHYKANPTTKTVAQVGGALAPALVGDEAGLAGLGKVGAEGLEAATVAREGAALAPEAGALVRGGEAVAPEAQAVLRGGAGVANDVDALAMTEAAARAEPGIAGRLVRGAYNTATLPTHLTSKAGQLAQQFAGAIVGDNSPSLLARTAQQVIKQGGAGAAEGALYGLGNELSEEALGGEDINAQKLFAAAGHNALFGAALGGTLGGGGELAKAGLTKIARSDALGKLVDTQAWRSLSPNKPITREADKYVKGGHEAIGNQLVKDGILAPGDAIDQIAPKIRAKKEEIFDQLGAFHGRLGDMGAEGVKFSELQSAIEKDIPPIIKKLGESSPLAGKIDKQFKQLATLVDERGRIPLKDLNDFRKQVLDEEIKWNQGIPANYGQGPSPETRMLQSVRGHVEDAFIHQIDREAQRLSGKLPGEAAAEYKGLKSQAQKYIVADKAATQALAAKYSNQSLSLTDKMAGFSIGGGALAGAIASGGASIPAHLAHAALGLGASYASKLVRERGNATVAALLGRARDLGAIAQVTKRFDGRVTQEVAKALHGAPYRSKAADLDDYDGVAARVRLAQSKIAHDQAVDGHLGTIADHAPKTAAAFSGVVRRATILLAQKLPAQTYHPLGADPPPSDSQKAELVRAARIIEDPLAILKDVRAGSATAEDIDTLKKVHPDIYTQLQTEVSKQINTDKTVPYANKLAMARLMGIDLDGTYNPQFVQAMQMNLTSAQQQKPGKPPKAHKANFKSKAPSSMTLNSRATSSQYQHI